MTKKVLPRRQYHDGDIVEFDFEANSLDICWHKVALIGVVSGILYEKEGIHYKVRIRDNKRNIFGDLVISEEMISGTIEDSVVTTKCDFCDLRVHIDQKNSDDIERKTKGWEKAYCIGKRHHILNMCHRCVDILGGNKKLKCPHDQCPALSKEEKDRLEENVIKPVDKI